MQNKPRRVLVLGSGGIQIGQAGEFDYSGSQALKALREEGIYTVLINPNIATIQTSEHMADQIYLLPVTPYFVKQIIEKEHIDALFVSFGGQTALNCALELWESKELERLNVRICGTSAQAIKITEDRKLFAEELRKIEVQTPKSEAAQSVEEAVAISKRLGFPLMLRGAYSLGGLGSGVAWNEKELQELCTKIIQGCKQVLVEEYLHGWKEIEYEVMRDMDDNCITICNMENLDPMGVHTGESIVVAPSQTLTNHEYHFLRSISQKVVRHLGIIGECNIQYAMHPITREYRVIEVNARLSRSSALASKATGYPIARIAAKVLLGYNLGELKNEVTKTTPAFFEPALDYIVVKIPRWDLNKFQLENHRIGTEMRSVGEVMGIGRTFPEAFQKALRMLHIGVEGIWPHPFEFPNIEDELRHPTDKRIFAVANAIAEKYDTKTIAKLSGIDPWFIDQIRNIIEELARSRDMNAQTLRTLKCLGFSDNTIASAWNRTTAEVTQMRREHNIHPVVKQIDTLAAEYKAKTNYLYLTYHGNEHDIEFEKDDEEKRSVLILGSGVYCIGSSVEFDWCCVNSAIEAKNVGYTSIMINNNPETVSTDYDTCDRLYFEELSAETIEEIYGFERPNGVIVSMGGQIPNNVALHLEKSGLQILGTKAASIDRAENRHSFAQLLDAHNIAQPRWKEVTTVEEAKKFCEAVGYPVIVRPSYVLSGAAMRVVYSAQMLEGFLKRATVVSRGHPVVLSKFMEGHDELELDAVAQHGKLVCTAISEHVEHAGVHSGDATHIFPAQHISADCKKRILEIGATLAKELAINGPFNIQFLVKEENVSVIECNLRASRSFPFVSKVWGTNMASLATKILLGEMVEEKATETLSHVGVKSPQFSFYRFKNVLPRLGVEMASTGEVACLGKDVFEALLKSMMCTGQFMPRQKKLFLSGVKVNKDVVAALLQRGYQISQDELSEQQLLEALRARTWDIAVIIDKPELARSAVQTYTPLITDARLADIYLRALTQKDLKDILCQPISEYHAVMKKV